MLSGNGTIDYSVEAHTLDAHKTSAARQEPTTRNLQELLIYYFNIRQAAFFYSRPLIYANDIYAQQTPTSAPFSAMSTSLSISDCPLIFVVCLLEEGVLQGVE